MDRVFRSDLSVTRVEKVFPAARFEDRTRCPECWYTRKLWGLKEMIS